MCTWISRCRSPWCCSSASSCWPTRCGVADPERPGFSGGSGLPRVQRSQIAGILATTILLWVSNSSVTASSGRCAGGTGCARSRGTRTSRCQLDPGAPSLAVERLDLHPRPARPDHGIVEAVRDAAHRRHEARGVGAVGLIRPPCHYPTSPSGHSPSTEMLRTGAASNSGWPGSRPATCSPPATHPAGTPQPHPRVRPDLRTPRAAPHPAARPAPLLHEPAARARPPPAW